MGSVSTEEAFWFSDSPHLTLQQHRVPGEGIAHAANQAA